MTDGNETIEENGDDFSFISPTKGRRNLLEIMADIIGYIADKPDAEYSIVVGTDSELSSHIMADGNDGYIKKERKGLASFVSVIVMRRIGSGAKYFWKRTTGVRTFDHHDRMIKEAYFSLEVANKLISQLRDKLNGHFYDFEIHLDIGLNGPTKEMIQEIVGLIKGNGFKAIIKPYSYAAKTVAD